MVSLCWLYFVVHRHKTFQNVFDEQRGEKQAHLTVPILKHSPTPILLSTGTSFRWSLQRKVSYPKLAQKTVTLLYSGLVTICHKIGEVFSSVDHLIIILPILINPEKKVSSFSCMPFWV
jgi:hypothetical protein